MPERRPPAHAPKRAERLRPAPPRPALRTRVSEMREPPLGLEEVPDPALQVLFDEILAAPTTAELLAGIYEKAIPALDAALVRHLTDTNPLTDAPSVRVIRFAENRGSGSARKAGTRAARGRVVVWTDADMTYPNDQIPALVKELDGYDQVVGARTSEQGTHRAARVPATAHFWASSMASLTRGGMGSFQPRGSQVQSLTQPPTWE